MDVELWRGDNKEAYTNVPHIIKQHSPTGFEWGYNGSGPADLALNILYQFIGYEAQKLYHEFKDDFIAVAPRNGTTIPGYVIVAWLQERGYLKDAERLEDF